MLTHLTKKPGEFKARCNLSTVVKIARATAEQSAEARDLGLQRHHGVTDTRGKDIWTWHFPACGGFETDDREAYQAHLDEFHNGGQLKLEGPPIQYPVPMWKAPRLTEAGKPLTTKAAERTRTCGTCSLIAEVVSTASVQWWAEHTKGCAIAMAGAAS